MILNCPECGQPHHVDDDDTPPMHAYCTRCVDEVTWSIPLPSADEVNEAFAALAERQQYGSGGT